MRKFKDVSFFCLRRLYHLSLLGAVAFGGYKAWYFLQNPAVFPVKNVQIQGAWRHTKQGDLQEALLAEMGHGFLNLNVETLKTSLLQFPWIQSVEVQKIWPGKLVVTLKEHEPEFIVNQRGMMTVQGVFVPVHVSTLPTHLPELFGPPEKLTEMRQEYFELQSILKPTQLKIAALTLAPRGSWKLKLNNGTELYLGRDDILNRLRQYVRIYPQLVQHKGTSIVSVDLRYRNGAAVRVQSVG